MHYILMIWDFVISVDYHAWIPFASGATTDAMVFLDPVESL